MVVDSVDDVMFTKSQVPWIAFTSGWSSSLLQDAKKAVVAAVNKKSNLVIFIDFGFKFGIGEGAR